MMDCRYNSKLSAYHDGELDAQTSRLLQDHLSGCAECSQELASLKKISSLFAADFASETLRVILPGRAGGEISQIELARLHQNVDPSRLNGRLEQADDSELLRTAGLLCALAASVLIVSTVWLAELPTRHAATVSPAGAVVSASGGLPNDLGGGLAGGNVLVQSVPAWERVAMTLHVDPRPDYPGDTIGFASANTGDAELTDWMISGLAGRANHANP